MGDAEVDGHPAGERASPGDDGRGADQVHQRGDHTCVQVVAGGGSGARGDDEGAEDAAGAAGVDAEAAEDEGVIEFGREGEG